MTKRIDFSKIRTYPIRERENKIGVGNFCRGLPRKGIGFKGFWDGLPDVFAAKAFKAVVGGIINAKKKDRPVIFCLGAHVIKCGLAPIIISLMEKRIITFIALNGAGSIHDFEISLIGQTSEDVESGLEDGTFGMADETGRFMNEAISQGVKQGIGAGKSLGERILKDDFRFREYSILARAVELGVPVSVHIAVGTDIIHQHPRCDGASLGEASFLDFQMFTEEVSRIGAGGVVVNAGSAVILPEVFLKALTISRNLGYKVKDFITADIDMIRHYRPEKNVVSRPVSAGGRGYSITGHHEIMIPMLAQAVAEGIEQL